MEIPVSAGFSRVVAPYVREFWLDLPDLMKRVLRKLKILRPVWAFPAEDSSSHILSMLLAELSRKSQVLNLAIHSSELAVGASPRTRTSADVEQIFHRLNTILRMLESEPGCTFQTLSDACRMIKAKGPGCAPVPAHSNQVSSHQGNPGPTVVPEKTSRQPELAYILAASHSGSTLLAMLLASHPETCTTGELKATSLGDPRKYPCSCGVSLGECEFWRDIRDEMERRGFPFDIADAGTDFGTNASSYVRCLLKPLHRGRAAELVRDLLLWLSPSWRTNLPMLQRRNRVFIEAICHCYDAHIAIDSSKIGLRLKYLVRDREMGVKVVRLIRDGRAVALTYYRPELYTRHLDQGLPKGTSKDGLLEEARSMAQAEREWRRSNEEAEHVLQNLSPSQWIEVRYEDLCTDPDRTLDHVFRFLGVDPSRSFRNFRSRARHIVGNSMRLDVTEEIKLDDRWRTVLTSQELREFDAIAGEMNRRYGYE
jgi:hypothetical protein